MDQSDVIGALDLGLVIVPVYVQKGLPTVLGSRMRKIYLDARGHYRVPENIFAPDYLAVCSLDAYGLPIPVDVIAPGADASVAICSLRLSWDEPVDTRNAIVVYDVGTSALRVPIEFASTMHQVMWDLDRPLLLEGLPCGEIGLTVQAGDQWLVRRVALNGGVVDVVFP